MAETLNKEREGGTDKKKFKWKIKKMENLNKEREGRTDKVMKKKKKKKKKKRMKGERKRDC